MITKKKYSPLIMRITVIIVNATLSLSTLRLPSLMNDLVPSTEDITKMTYPEAEKLFDIEQIIVISYDRCNPITSKEAISKWANEKYKNPQVKDTLNLPFQFEYGSTAVTPVKDLIVAILGKNEIDNPFEVFSPQGGFSSAPILHNTHQVFESEERPMLFAQSHPSYDTNYSEPPQQDQVLPLILVDQNDRQMTYNVPIDDIAQLNHLGGKWLNLRRNLYGYNSNHIYRH